jgi:hypothetical protein
VKGSSPNREPINIPHPAISQEQQLVQNIQFTESESQPWTVSDKSLDVINPVSETQCPIDGMTANREIGIQCELLIDQIPIFKPMTACIATQTETLLPEITLMLLKPPTLKINQLKYK